MGTLRPKYLLYGYLPYYVNLPRGSIVVPFWCASIALFSLSIPPHFQGTTLITASFQWNQELTGGSHLESYKVIPKRNYFGALGKLGLKKYH